MPEQISETRDREEQSLLHHAVRVTEALMTEADRIAEERLVMGFTGPAPEVLLQALASSYLAAAVSEKNRRVQPHIPPFHWSNAERP